MFLEMWAMTRIRPVSPCPGLPHDVHPPSGLPRFPLAYMWKKLTHSDQHVVRHNVVFIRDPFDQLTPEQIDWQPYGDINAHPEYCTRGRYMWHSSVPLICNEKIEWHLAWRIMRQFEFIQVVPTEI